MRGGKGSMRFLPWADLRLIERSAGLHTRWPAAVVQAKLGWNWLLGLPHQVLRVDTVIVGPNALLCALAARGVLIRQQTALIAHRPQTEAWPYDLLMAQTVRGLLQRLGGLDRLDGLAAAQKGAREAAIAADVGAQAGLGSSARLAATRSWLDELFARLLDPAQVDSAGRLWRLDRAHPLSAAPEAGPAGILFDLTSHRLTSARKAQREALPRLVDSALEDALARASQRLVVTTPKRGRVLLIAGRLVLAGQPEGVAPLALLESLECETPPRVQRLGSARPFPNDPRAMLLQLVDDLVAAVRGPG